MLTKEVSHQFTVQDDGAISVRQSEKLYEDGEFVAERLHRRVLEPGADLSTEPQRLAAVAKAIWTPKLIRDFKAARTAAMAAAMRPAKG